MVSNAISNILGVILILLIAVLMILSIVFLILKSKESSNKRKEKNSSNKTNSNTSVKKADTKTAITYNKKSIFDFMEFDSITDNMIVQKDGRRYLMVVECQGVNYDLMSQMEKVSVEEGFQQFLNTLRHPIQIYIQTRTVNLESSVNTYKAKVKEIQENYNRMKIRYDQMKQSETFSQEELQKYFYELTKQRNLVEYGLDIISNTEKMSLNKNVLNQKYYIVIPYFSEENPEEKFDKDEIANMAFSELYTKAQSIIRAISACSVKGKILNSSELVELLYMAYNREDAEIYNLERAMRAQYDSLYSTAPDVFAKKLKTLDEEINRQAIDLANNTIEKVKTRMQEQAEEKEDDMEELINKMAQVILSENKQYVGEKVAEAAIKEIQEGGNENETKVKKSTRGRKKQSVN